MTRSPATSEVASGLRRWLAHSEPISRSGAYVAWYDADSGRQAFEYPEITGYALTHLAGQVSAEPDERDATAGASRWLVERWTSGDRSARADWDDDRCYYFDVAMQANGLLLAGSRLRLPDAVETACEMVVLLLEHIEQEGTLAAVALDTPSARTGWSTQGAAHMGKALQCILHAGAVDSELRERAMDAAAAISRHVVAQQQADGRFVTDPSDRATLLHPHLYAVEGLWCHAEATGDEGSLEAARAGAAWVWQHQLPTGGLPRLVSLGPDAEDGPEQLDATAQAVRVAALFDMDHAAAQRAADRLTDLAVSRDERGMALPYQPDSGQKHLNSWVALFAAQALALWARDRAISWKELV